MGLYARGGWKWVRQATADIFMLVWAIVWWLVSRFTEATITVFGEPARGVADAANKLGGSLRDMGEQADQIPYAGDGLRQQLEGAAGHVDSIVTGANDQVAAVESAAHLAGWLVFLIPVLIWAVRWLPPRVRFVLRQRASQRFVDSSADLDLFALRALASQPLHVLAAISPDPVRAWREGDRRVIDALADLELRGAGLSTQSITQRRDAGA